MPRRTQGTTLASWEVSKLTEYPVEEFDRVLGVNVRGAFLSIKSAAPLIAKRGGGAIIVTSSVAGLIGAAGLSAYVASKHAIMGLVKTAAVELAPLGIPMHRYAESSEIAALTAFLASDDASYCTGALFVIDGGYTAQ